MTSTSSRPLSSLPAFPVLVALWFAALLGAGTFVLPAAIFESAASATGLAEIIPAAQPPLGTTARLAITIAAAILGALIGLFVAWQVRRASRPAHAADPSDAPLAAEEQATPSAAEDSEARTAWQAWRENMTEDADDYGDMPDSDADGSDEAERGVDFARLEAALRDEDTDEGPCDGIDTDEFEGTDNPPLADDPQRAEADRLVAGLARLRREDDGPRAFDDGDPIAPPAIPLPDEDDHETLSFRDDNPDEREEVGIFDPSFVSETPPMRDEADDLEPEQEIEREPAPQRREQADTAQSQPTDTLSLPELVARLELAIDAVANKTAADRETRNARDQRDEVVSFPGNETPRGNQATPNADSGAADSQTMLRAALAKLDQVGNRS
ncbi:MAG: hypothetical protein GW854_09030 [Erythrobacter sp.]|nr:hypothetical protein [Erythrobacter sp.]